MESVDPEPALWVPGPVGYDWVDEASYHNAVDNVSNKVATLGQRPRHQSSCGGSENELEKPLGKLVGCKRKGRFLISL